MDIAADTVDPVIFFLKELPPTQQERKKDYPPATQRPGDEPQSGREEE